MRRAVPFICECADPRCTAIVRMSLEAFEEVRADPAWFLNAPAHESVAPETKRLVAKRGGYRIVETIAGRERADWENDRAPG